jgi:hypothetical protein
MEHLPPPPPPWIHSFCFLDGEGKGGGRTVGRWLETILTSYLIKRFSERRHVPNPEWLSFLFEG